MSELYIDALNAPLVIKSLLKMFSTKYQLVKEVTKGTNGYLFFGNNRILNTKIAIKFYYWGGDKTYHAEPQHLARMKSPNILSILDAGYVDTNWAYFVTPFCSNGDIDDLLETTRLGNIEAITLASQILNGLTFLHSERLLHRDIKPSNIYLDDNKQAIIGDFGSIKKVPEGKESIPTSSHTVLYRPVESINNNIYSFRGDVYQVGIVLYQLLGGYLPYEEYSWLTKNELKHYHKLTDSADKSIFVDQCIKNRVKKGKIVSINTLPPWVPSSLHRIIIKATNSDPSKRYASPSAFMAKLNAVKFNMPNWLISDGVPTLVGKTSYRIIVNNNDCQVWKHKNNGLWRKDNSFKGKSMQALVGEINDKGSE